MSRIVFLENNIVINWVDGDLARILAMGINAIESDVGQIGQRYENGQFFDVDPVVYDNPVITLPAYKAIIMLNRAGILDQVEQIAATVSPEASIALNRASEMSSDNTLVRSILGPWGVGLSDEQIYQLFVDAQSIE